MSRELALIWLETKEDSAHIDATYPNLSSRERYLLLDRMRKAREARLGGPKQRIKRLVAQLEQRVKELEAELALERLRRQDVGKLY